MNIQENIKRILREIKEKIEDFASTRGKGAEKIATNAKEKGGLALLTYEHFKVKLPYYRLGLFSINNSPKTSSRPTSRWNPF